MRENEGMLKSKTTFFNCDADGALGGTSMYRGAKLAKENPEKQYNTAPRPKPKAKGKIKQNLNCNE